jgi:hypothetical protein
MDNGQSGDGKKVALAGRREILRRESMTKLKFPADLKQQSMLRPP